MKKSISLLLSAAVLLSTGAGCASGTKQPDSAPLSGELNLHISTSMKAWLEPAIALYQERWPQVQVNVEDHNEDDWFADTGRIRAELMAGRGADIVYNPQYHLEDIHKAMRSGAFADLTPWLEESFAPDELETGLLEAGQLDGRQYVLPLTYNLSMLLSTREALAEYGVDQKACEESILGILREGSGYLERGGTAGFYNQLHRVMYFPDYLGLPMLDYKERTADLSAPEYREAIELYRQIYSQDMREVESLSYGTYMAYEDISGRRAVFGLFDFSTTLDPFLNAGALSVRETPVLIPIRSVDGKVPAMIYQSAAVRRGGNEENALAFLEILLSEEWQNAGINQMCYPMRKSCFENRLEAARHAGEDMNGPVESGPVPEDVLAALESARGEIGHAEFGYGFLSEQTLAAMEPYYKGDQSLDSCLSGLQNTLDIYMSE